MAAPVVGIHVEGLEELRRDLRAIDAKMPRQLTRINREVADLVAPSAQAAARGYGGVRALAAPNIRARAEQRYAVIAIGGAPYAAGAMLGARRYRQFPSYVGAGDPTAIYGVGDAIREETADILRLYAERMAELITE
jgi:hypothetical protein